MLYKDYGFPKSMLPLKGFIGVILGLGFPKIRGTFAGVPRIRMIAYWGLYWRLLILGHHHLGSSSHSFGTQGLGSKVWVLAFGRFRA